MLARVRLFVFGLLLFSSALMFSAIASSESAYAQSRVSGTASGGTYLRLNPRNKQYRYATRANRAKIIHNNRAYGYARKSTLADRARRFHAEKARSRSVRSVNVKHRKRGFYYTQAVKVRGREADPCPKGHNCGYRLYEDRTGPRIIVPGISGEGLPPQDGLRGPKIIRVK